MELLIFIIVGIFTGLSAGLLGIGGGLVSVPAMIFILPYFDVPSSQVMHLAIATSLALIIPTSIISAYSHSLHHAIFWPSVIRFLPGLLLGGGVGAYVVTFMQRETLQGIFAVFLLLIALQMLRAKKADVTAELAEVKPDSVQNAFIPTTVIGAISALMGVGGGTMTVPYLVWRGLPLPKAIGTSAVCGLPIALSGSAVFFVLEAATDYAEPFSSVYLPGFIGILMGVIVFAPIGAKLAHQLNNILLKRIFIAMLLLVAVKLFVDN